MEPLIKPSGRDSHAAPSLLCDAFSNFNGGAKDAVFGVLFVVHQVFLWTLIGVMKENNASSSPSSSSSSDDDAGWHLHLLPILGAAALLATSVSLALLFLLVHYTGTMIKVVLLGSAVLCGVVGAVFCLQSNFGMGFAALACTCLSLWYYHSVHQYSRLTKAMVLMSTLAFDDESQLTKVLAAMLSAQVIWLALAVFATLTCLLADGSSSQQFGLLFVIFSHYWTSGVLKGMLHVAVAGGVAQRTILGNDAPLGVTRVSFVRAASQNFGSVCFASLLVPMTSMVYSPCVSIIRKLEMELGHDIFDSNSNYGGGSGGRVFGPLLFVTSVVKFLAQRCNKLSYAHMSIFGCSHVTSSRNAWELLEHHDAKDVIVGDVPDGVLTFGAIAGGVLTASLGGLWSAVVFYEDHSDVDMASDGSTYKKVVLSLLLCFFIGHSMAATVLRVFAAAYDALLISALSYPCALSFFFPERTTALANVWRDTYGECNWHGLGPVVFDPPFLAYAPTGGGMSRRALLIACSGKGIGIELQGVDADVARQQTMLIQNFGFRPEDIRVLSDSVGLASRRPTANNVRIGLCWLLAGAQPGDARFFHFSGYATHLPDNSGERAQGWSEGLVLLDCDEFSGKTLSGRSGSITDDELRERLFRALPSGVDLVAFFDTSHSGTLGTECRTVLRNAKGHIIDEPVETDDDAVRVKTGSGNARFLTPSPHTLADFDRARLAYEDHPRQNSFSRRCKQALDTDTNGGDKSIIVFRTCGPTQHAEELNIDGKMIGVGTWAFSEAMRKTNYAGSLPALKATMKTLLEEGDHPQDFHVAASRVIREDPDVSLFRGTGTLPGF